MSKFEEMCRAFTEARKMAVEYRDRCFRHISTLSSGFVEHCEIPKGCFSFAPAKNSDVEKQYSPLDAIQFESDGYWHLAWRVCLFEAPNVFPQQQALIRLALRESQNGKVLVKRAWEQEAHELDLNDKGQCRLFYDGIVARVKEYFGRNPQDFTDDSRAKTSIGFQV